MAEPGRPKTLDDVRDLFKVYRDGGILPKDTYVENCGALDIDKIKVALQIGVEDLNAQFLMGDTLDHILKMRGFL